MLEELGLFPDTVAPSTQVLFINFGDTEALYCLRAVNELRKSQIMAELYPDKAKMKKQMGYANKRNIPYVVLAGTSEIENNTFTVKEMQSGDQMEVNLEELKMMIL